MNALVIGDRLELRNELESQLSVKGFNTRCVAVRNAVVECEQTQWPALVVLDCVGGNAWDLCRRIRALPGGNLALIWVVNEQSDSQSPTTAREAGADECLPFPPDALWLDLRIASAIRQIAAMQEIPRAHAALRESLDRWALVERGARGGVWDAMPSGLPLDSPNLPVWYSLGMKQLFGYSEAEFPNVLGSWLSRVHPDEAEPVMQAIIQCLEDKSQFEVEYRLLTKAGGYRWFSSRGQGILDAGGRLVRVAGTVRDVTENHHAADALQASEAKWRSLVENAPDTITVVEPEGRILFMNRAWPQMTDEQALGKDLISLAPEERRETIRTVLQDVARSGRPGRFELTLPSEDGKPIWYASRVGPIHAADGITTLVIITTNITARKRYEQALRDEQELLRRLLDLHERDRKLIAYEIHDGLAQEMTGALMHLQAFEHSANEGLESVDFDRGLSLLREAVQEARRLISGLRPPVLDELGIVAAIEYLIHEIKPEVPDISFVHRTKFVRLAPPLESAIFRIVQEALSNIRAHSGSERAWIELIEHGPQLRLVVRDQGKGFDLTHVNEGRFGLQGIRQRGRLLGAPVVIESHPGKGTTLVVDFPLIVDRNEDGSEREAASGS